MSLLHMSISAADPEKVARFLATILGGRAMLFPPFPDSWIAFSGSDDGTAIEVYPDTHILSQGAEQVSCEVGAVDQSETFVHAAISSSLSAEAIMLASRQYEWPARICNRGPFHCVEVWLEHRLLVEILDSEMQKDYRKGMTMDNWSDMFGLN